MARTWTTEGDRKFEGASDEVIDGHRPNLALDPGRKSGAGVVLVVFLLAVGGLIFAGWWFRDDLAGFFDEPAAGDTGDTGGDEDGTGDDGGEMEMDAPTAPPPDLPAGPGPSKGSPWGGEHDPGATAAGQGAKPSGGDGAAAADTGAPPAPDTVSPPASDTGAPATPSTEKTTLKRGEMTIRGVSSRRATTTIDGLTPKLEACAAAFGGANPGKSASVSVRFTVHWNGSAKSLAVSTDDATLKTCFRSAFARARYPQPPAGKDGSVRIEYSLTAG